MSSRSQTLSLGGLVTAGALTLSACGSSGPSAPDLSTMSAKAIIKLATDNLKKEPSFEAKLTVPYTGQSTITMDIVSDRHGSAKIHATFNGTAPAPNGSFEVVSSGGSVAVKFSKPLLEGILAQQKASSGLSPAVMNVVVSGMADHWISPSSLNKAGFGGFNQLTSGITQIQSGLSLKNLEQTLGTANGPLGASIAKDGTTTYHGDKVAKLTGANGVVYISTNATPLPVYAGSHDGSEGLELSYPGTVTITVPRSTFNLLKVLSEAIAKDLNAGG